MDRDGVGGLDVGHRHDRISWHARLAFPHRRPRRTTQDLEQPERPEEGAESQLPQGSSTSHLVTARAERVRDVNGITTRTSETAISRGCMTGWNGTMNSSMISKTSSTPPVSTEPSHGQR